jgi:hypothetical protein
MTKSHSVMLLAQIVFSSPEPFSFFSAFEPEALNCGKRVQFGFWSEHFLRGEASSVASAVQIVDVWWLSVLTAPQASLRL